MSDNPQEAAKVYQEFTKGLWRENPVFIQVLGMCPTLAVTNTAINALAMGSATTVVLIASCVFVSLLRKVIPGPVRISTYVVIIATFVSVVDLVLQALAPAVHKELGAFIALIVVNCVILGRQEAFASKVGPLLAAVDAAGMGLGFTLGLSTLGIIREVLGNGSLFGVDLLGPHFEPWVVMVLPPGGFLVLGLVLLMFSVVKRAKTRTAVDKEAS